MTICRLTLGWTIMVEGGFCERSRPDPGGGTECRGMRGQKLGAGTELRGLVGWGLGKNRGSSLLGRAVLGAPHRLTWGRAGRAGRGGRGHTARFREMPPGSQMTMLQGSTPLRPEALPPPRPSLSCALLAFSILWTVRHTHPFRTFTRGATHHLPPWEKACFPWLSR